jgi:hypothetical protein
VRVLSKKVKNIASSLKNIKEQCENTEQNQYEYIGHE